MAKDLAIVLNNGSVNAAVATALAVQRYRPILLHIEIGTATRLRAAYDQQVGHFKPYREHTIPLAYMAPLLDPAKSAAVASDPRAQTTELGARMLAMLPMLSAAVQYAVHYQAVAVYLGFRVGGSADDLASATEFGQIWNELVQMPCGQKDIELLTPLLELDPWQVVDVGFQVNAPLDKTWSCLEEMSEPCWSCAGCRARERAFQQSGKIDPMRIVRKV